MIFRTKEAQDEYERNKESLRILKHGGCWISEEPKNIHGCIGAKTANGANDCTACVFYNDFYSVARSYAEQDGITTSESIWLARQFFGIESTYMCDGNDGEWYKEHDPKKYAALLKRQAELMNETPPEEPAELATKEIKEPPGQMSIMDWFNEN